MERRLSIRLDAERLHGIVRESALKKVSWYEPHDDDVQAAADGDSPDPGDSRTE